MTNNHSDPDHESILISPSMGPLLDAEQVGKTKGLIDRRVLYLCWLALIIALMMGFVSKGLVMLIGFFTNLFFYGSFSVAFSSPAGNHLGAWVIVIPVIGGLIVGVMARYGSSAIRGHGIPEAMEQVLENESRIPPKITFLKPISAAIAIGTGGPFGAEGPIIATGGALGSFFGQILKTTPDERKILLAAGATAGMAAIFGSPVSAVLLAIELLLFEFSPRSIIPVAVACATGAGIHIALDGTAPMFPLPLLQAPGSSELLVYTVIGILIGTLGVVASKIVYAVEDLFEKLPVHWMWWPALGGVGVGFIGWIAPDTLGVGYSNIQHVLEGNLAIKTLLLLCSLKFASWAIALGSGTSGGTLAPLLTIGSAAGALTGMLAVYLFPSMHMSIGTAALIGMAAMFTGASRALLTSIIFAFETTLQPLILLPLLASCTAAYVASFLLMKNTIMTEKIARRGISVPGVYSPDYFDKLNVMEAVLFDFFAVRDKDLISMLKAVFENEKEMAFPETIPVIDEEDVLKGFVRSKDIEQAEGMADEIISRIQFQMNGVIYPDSKLKDAIKQLAASKDDLIPVLSRTEPGRLLGIVTPKSILDAYENARKRNFNPGRTIHIRKRGIRVIILAREMQLKRRMKKGSK
jgi:CIC family chloride channel protein